jgi:hypothetical protein
MGEAEDLALTQSDERERERRLVAVAGEGRQDAAGHVWGERRTRVARDAPEGDLERDVAADKAAHLGRPQGLSDHDLGIAHGLGRRGSSRFPRRPSVP